MRPQGHPDFFRLPPPEGRSRESAIVLAADGCFYDHGAPVEHRGMARAFASWLDVHPDDGRFILNNGYDWSYLEVADSPFFVLGLREEAGKLWLRLFDGSENELETERRKSPLEVGPQGALYTTVKAGKFRARFTRGAATALEPWLAEGEDGTPYLQIAGRRYPVGNIAESPRDESP